MHLNLGPSFHLSALHFVTGSVFSFMILLCGVEHVESHGKIAFVL